MTYSDVLAMPTYERRFFLGLLTKQIKDKEEYIENLEKTKTTSGSKGVRTSTLSGNALKQRMNNGNIPLK